MIRFIHAADIHLDSPLRGLERYEGAPVDEIRGATRRALENLVDLAIAEQVDFVLIAGDLYDGDWKDHQTGLFFVRMMSRLREADIPVIAIRGNHDAANRMTKSLVLPENVEMLSHSQAETACSTRLEELGVAVHGRSFGQAAEYENMARDYPDPRPGFYNIGLLHTSLGGAEGHEPYAPCTIEDLRQKGYDYWALGHIHLREILCEDPWVVFSGNIQGRHIRETGEKGCYLVTVDDRHRTTLEFQPLDVFRWEICEVDATGMERSAELLRTCSERVAGLLEHHGGLPLGLRFEVGGRCPLHEELVRDPERWTHELRAAAIDASGGDAWVEKIKLRTRAARDLSEWDADEGPVGELLRFLRELEEDDQPWVEFAAELEDLVGKLPSELVRDEEFVDLRDPVRLRAWLADAEGLLMGRLLDASDE